MYTGGINHKISEAMRHFSRSFQTYAALIILVYFLPIFIWSLYAKHLISPDQEWSLVSTGLLISLFGSALLIILSRFREVNQSPMIMERVIEASLPGVDQEKEKEAFQLALEEKEQRIAQLTLDIELIQEGQTTLQQTHDRLNVEYRAAKNQLEKQLEDLNSLEADQKRTIEQQRILIDQKQQNITHLENQIHDLRYEIKTLLQLAEMDPASDFKPAIIDFMEFAHQEVDSGVKSSLEVAQKVHTLEEASLLLKRCLANAQKITSGYPFSGGSSRLRDIPMEHHALDLRRLFDGLRSENSATVAFYSKKDQKILFVNNQVKSLLGVSPEKFLQDFAEIAQDGIEEWKSGLVSLDHKQESHTRLLLKNRADEDVLAGCCMGSISSGVFKGDVVVVIYPL